MCLQLDPIYYFDPICCFRVDGKAVSSMDYLREPVVAPFVFLAVMTL